MKFEAAQQGYRNLWNKAKIRPEKRATVRGIAQRLASNRHRYEAVSQAVGCPWWWVAITHQMESGARFTTHLHNGDPLSARTVHYPPGRPPSGKPPFTWEASALDALLSHKLDEIKTWSLERCLYEFERYNGWGYLGKINSPYLWSYTDLYTKGKWKEVLRKKRYVSVYDSELVSQQAGAVAILKEMIAQGAVDLINDGETAMAELTAKVKQYKKIMPHAVKAIEDGDEEIVVQALAEKLEVENQPSVISAKMKAMPLLQLIPILEMVEEVVTRVLPVILDEPTPVPDPDPKPVSPIDETFGLTGYKTIIGLGIAVIAWVLSGLSVITPDIATVAYGIATFIGGAGVKAWMDRLQIGKKT